MPKRYCRALAASLLFLFLAGHARAQYLNHYFNPRDANSHRLSGVPLFGRTAGMGGLEFTVPDSLRDIHLNPAKKYSARSHLFSAPYLRRLYTQNGSYEFTTQFGQIIRTYKLRSRSYFTPAGGIWRGNGWYGGGYIGFADVYQSSYRRVTADDFLFEQRQEVGFSGWPFSLLAGAELLPGVRFGASYSYSSQSYYDYDLLVNTQTVSALTQKDEYLKAGTEIRLGPGRIALLGSYYRQQYELQRTTGFSNNNRKRGLFLQGEYHREMGRGITLSGRLGYDTREQDVVYRFEEAVGFSGYDNGVVTSWQFGLGIVKRLPELILAAEVEHQPSSYSYTVDQSEENVKQWKIRTGVEVPIAEHLHGQFGISWHSYKMRSLESVIINSNGGIDERNPAMVSTLTRFTGGMSWKADPLEILLHLSLSTYTAEIRINNDLDSDIITPYTGRIAVVYYL